MYDRITEHLKERKVLSRSKYYNLNRRDKWPNFFWELHPLAHEYYHELNPYFLFNIHSNDLFRFSKLYTIRDGYLTFASYILNNYSTFQKISPELLLIHPDLAPLVPPHLASYFGCWKIVQKKQTALKEAKKVIVFGFVSDEYLGDLDTIEKKLVQLKKVSENTKIEIFLPLRRNLFDPQGRESLLIHHLVSLIKDVLPGRNVPFLTTNHFFDITDFKGTVVFDLAADNFLVSDSYLHHYVQGRGATVHNSCLKSAPTDSVYSTELSFYHELHVTPLPVVKNVFTDLIFYKKQATGVKEYTTDLSLQVLLRTLMKKES